MKYLLTILVLLFGAATALAQVPDPSTVQQSVDALGKAGPWLGLLLVAAAYADMRTRESRCQESIAKLNARIDGLQDQRVSASEHDAATLLAHAREMGKIVGDNTAATDRVTEALNRLAERLK